MHTQVRSIIPPDEIRDIAGGLNGLLKRIDCCWFDRRHLKFLATAENRLIGPDAVDHLERGLAAIVEAVSTVPVVVSVRPKERGDDDDLT